MSIVIVGGGLAAAHSCETLRSAGYDGPLVLVGAERHLPYERPPLSKGYLLGSSQLEKAYAHDARWYADHDVELRLGSLVTAVDPKAHTVTTDQGPLGYDRLLLATGATPRRLPLADDAGADALYLRTIEDSERLRAAMVPGRRLVIVGAGWIGLEVAAAGRTLGCDVVVIEPLAHPLLRVLGPEVGALFAGLHRQNGVDLRTGVVPTAISRDHEATVVTLRDGSSIRADAVIVGIGAAPNTALAAAAGLEVDNGILTDDRLTTSDPDVFAAGDVANAFHPLLGRRLRVEHWDNAIAQGQFAARSMLGSEESFDRLPYFFSDQYDLGMEYVGAMPDGYDEVILRGDPDRLVFTAFWVSEDRVVAGMQANDWDATEHVRRIVARGAVELRGLRDPALPLEELAR